MPNERRYANDLNLESVGISLPYSMQAEQSVLGAVLLKPDTLTDLVEMIRPEMFYTRQNAQIWSEMLRLFTSDQTIDFVTLLDAVISDGVFASPDEAKVYLTGLAETVPSISNVRAYAQIVQEKYLVRQLMGVAKDILQDAGDEPDADLLLENAEQRIYEIRSGRDSSALTPLSSSMVETLSNLQKISGPDADKYKGIPTGFRLLDTVLTGLGRGDLIILAARPGMGKTSFALNIATRVAMQQKVPVAIFSLEMTKEQLTNRILSAEAGIDSQAFRTGALRAEDWEYLALATEKLHDAPIYMDDTSGITITEMKAKIRRVNQDPTRPNVGLIVIDYLQLMTSGQRTENRVQEIELHYPKPEDHGQRDECAHHRAEPAVPCGGKTGCKLQPPAAAVRPARLRLHRAGCRLRPVPVPRLLLCQPEPGRLGCGCGYSRVHRGKKPPW